MMKFAAAYWIIGCVICGSGYAIHANKCPNETLDNSPISLIVGVATWPAGLAAFASATQETIDKIIDCRSEHP